jgi:hypothetical protein
MKTRSQCECRPKMKAEPSSNLNSKNVPCLRHYLVCISVVRFFLLERTSHPVLTFKNLYDDSLGTGWKPGSSKIWTFWFWFYHFFSNSRTSGPSFWIGPVPCTHYTFLNATKFMTNFLEKSLIYGFFIIKNVWVLLKMDTVLGWQVGHSSRLLNFEILISIN